jgi:hypothetical protein
MQPFLSHESENWYQLQTLPTKSYICGFCSDKVSSEKGYKAGKHPDGSGSQIGAIHICPNCKGPTFFTPFNGQIPSPSIGRCVSHVPEELNKLYEEARRCTTNNCQTAAVLVCRKILMNIAV